MKGQVKPIQLHRDYSHRIITEDCDFISIPHGAVLTKFIAYSEGGLEIYNGRLVPQVEIHGFIGEDGTFYITDQKAFYPSKEEKEE